MADDQLVAGSVNRDDLPRQLKLPARWMAADQEREYCKKQTRSVQGGDSEEEEVGGCWDPGAVCDSPFLVHRENYSIRREGAN